MRDNSRTLTWAFLFVGLLSATAVVIAAWMITGGTKPQATASPTLIQPAAQTSSLLLPTPQGNLVFDENFDDGIATGMTVTGDPITNAKWEIIDNNNGDKLFQEENKSGVDWVGFTLGTTSITNGTIEYKVKLVDYGSSSVFCNFRQNSQSRYVFALGENDISIVYQDTEWHILNNAVAPYDFKNNVWYEVRIDLKGNEITVYLDSNKVLTTNDDKLKQGM